MTRDDGPSGRATMRRRPTSEEIIAATDRLHAKAGVRGPFPPITKAEWDEINEVPGLDGDDDDALTPQTPPPGVAGR
jgi:hypothetical protein